MTGEQLYQALVDAAQSAGVPIQRFVAPLCSGRDWHWKLEQLRIAKQPQHQTIARVRALIAGEPVPPSQPRRKGVYDPQLQGMTRVERDRLGLAPSRRAVVEAELAARAIRRRERFEQRRTLTELARLQRRPGQTLADCIRELEMATQA